MELSAETREMITQSSRIEQLHIKLLGDPETISLCRAVRELSAALEAERANSAAILLSSNAVAAELKDRLTASEAEAAELKRWVNATKNHAPYEAAGATWQVRHDDDQSRIATLEAEVARLRGQLERWEGTTSDLIEFWECVKCGDRHHGEASEAPWHTRENHEPICNKCGR